MADARNFLTAASVCILPILFAACSDDSTGPGDGAPPATGHVWSQKFGDTEQQIVRGIATDTAGNVIIVGQFRGTVDFGGGALASAGAEVSTSRTMAMWS